MVERKKTKKLKKNILRKPGIQFSTRFKPGRNRITILGIRKNGYSDFRIQVDSVSGFEHPY